VVGVSTRSGGGLVATAAKTSASTAAASRLLHPAKFDPWA
jgi:hypothetical protein